MAESTRISVAPAVFAPCAESLVTNLAISLRKVCDGCLLRHSIDMLNIQRANMKR